RERPRRRCTAEQCDEIASPHGRPSSFGPHITTPVRTNAAVHHSKDSALMSQMGHHARVGVTSSDLRRRSGHNFIKSFAIRTEPEKCSFSARAYRVIRAIKELPAGRPVIS